MVPLSLLYLVAYARRAHPDVNFQIADGQGLDMSVGTLKAVVNQGHWDMVGVTFWTAQAEAAYALADHARERTEAQVVLGGVHATLLPDEAIEHADVVVMHEGEETFTELVGRAVRGADIRDVAGTVTRANGGVRHNAPRPFIQDLGTVPFPAWDALPFIEYYDTPMHIVGGRRMPVVGSRGCPFNCNFCSSPLMWKRRLRWRSPANVADEICEIRQRLGITNIHFWDDNLMMKRSYVEGLCEGLLERAPDVKWVGLTRASHVVENRDLLPLMRRGGCIGIEIGLESFSDAAAEMAHKGEATATMMEASAAMREAGIVPLYTHMVFNPGERVSSYAQKREFLQTVGVPEFNSDGELGQCATPHVCTGFAEEAPNLGVVLAHRYAHYTHHRVNFVPQSLLEDVPVKTEAGQRHDDARASVHALMQETMLPCLHGFDRDKKRAFERAAIAVWLHIDGERTVREIAEAVKGSNALNSDTSVSYTALAIVGYGMQRLVASRAEADRCPE